MNKSKIANFLIWLAVWVGTLNLIAAKSWDVDTKMVIFATAMIIFRDLLNSLDRVK